MYMRHGSILSATGKSSIVKYVPTHSADELKLENEVTFSSDYPLVWGRPGFQGDLVNSTASERYFTSEPTCVETATSPLSQYDFDDITNLLQAVDFDSQTGYAKRDVPGVNKDYSSLGSAFRRHIRLG